VSKTFALRQQQTPLTFTLHSELCTSLCHCRHLRKRLSVEALHALFANLWRRRQRRQPVFFWQLKSGNYLLLITLFWSLAAAAAATNPLTVVTTYYV
jgi:hypothetical protein